MTADSAVPPTTDSERYEAKIREMLYRELTTMRDHWRFQDGVAMDAAKRLAPLVAAEVAAVLEGTDHDH